MVCNFAKWKLSETALQNFPSKGQFLFETSDRMQTNPPGTEIKSVKNILMSVIQCISMHSVHNKGGNYGGKISWDFINSCTVAVYGVDHSHRLPATITGLRAIMPYDYSKNNFDCLDIHLHLIFRNSATFWHFINYFI